MAAHLIKCLGTDSDRGFASDPERVFSVLIGLFRGYGLQHLYSEDLEVVVCIVNACSCRTRSNTST